MYTTTLKPNINTSNRMFSFSLKNIISKPVGSYMTYCESRSDEKIYWYLKSLIVIPCVIMVPSILVMFMSGVRHELFVGLCMVLFFSNVMVHIAEMSSKIYIPIYHLSIAIMLIIPSIAYILSL